MVSCSMFFTIFLELCLPVVMANASSLWANVKRGGQQARIKSEITGKQSREQEDNNDASFFSSSME